MLNEHSVSQRRNEWFPWNKVFLKRLLMEGWGENSDNCNWITIIFFKKENK